MARIFTLSALITRAQQHADMEGQSTIAAAEWKGYATTAYGEFYSLIIEAGMRHYESEQTITADGSASYALPADHLSTIGVDYVATAAGERSQLHELMIQERNLTGGLTGRAHYYSVVGSALKLFPRPSSGTYAHIYVPQPTDLSGAADNTQIDVITPDGESFIVWHLVVQAKTKEESELGPALAERERARERVLQWAQARAHVQPRRQVVSKFPLGLDDFDEGDWRWGW